MSTMPSQQEGQSSQQTLSSSSNLENADACGGPTSSSHASDSKRSDAAQLAQQLASSGPWSDAIMSPAHEASSSPRLPLHNSTLSNTNPLTSERSDYHSHVNQHDFDPPPAYSNLPQVHELPANPMNTMPTTRVNVPLPQEAEQPRSSGTDNGSGGPEEGPDVEQQPLLGPPSASCSRGGWIQWWRHRREKAAKRRRFKRFCCLLLFFVVVFISACALGNSIAMGKWTNVPARPSQSFVPTGPEYQRFETTKSISGAYKLYDKLELATTTGVIDVEIDPQPGHQPAYLLLSSDLGSITVTLSQNYRRRRNKAHRTIHTEIRSFTGSVMAELLLGSGGSALVDTTTGNQLLTVSTYNVGTHDNSSSLRTYSKTGAQKVVLTSMEPSYKTISKISAEHHGFATATLDIDYPSNWVGEVHGLVSPLGLLEVTGKDLEFTKTSEKEIIAARGPAKDRQRVDVISDGTGSAAFRC